MTNADHKAAIRERMASTGENYTTAKRAIEVARLKAQSEQPDSTLADQRTRTLNERFDTVAGQLGGDKPPAVRLAGVYAMAGLADDWPDHRQMCVDVLCAYLRMPYEPEPGDDAPVEERLALQASREVRHTVIRVITTHLNGTAPVSWCGLNLDFAGAVFDGDFSDAKFSGGRSTSPAPSSPGGRLISPAPSLPGDGQLRRRQVLRGGGQLLSRQVLRGEGQLRRRQDLRRDGRLRLRRVLRRDSQLH